MCGLVGKFAFSDDTVVERDLLERMSRTLAHRGPDDVGYYVKGRVGFGHRRLSIIDLEAGHQPLANEDHSIWVMFNGEIYNYVELREELARRGHQFRTASDTEVIVHLYEERGEDFVHALRGMFAIALWDERLETLILVRDRLGKKPLYYSDIGGKGIVFGSELQAVAIDPLVDREIDPEAVDAFLSLQYIPAPLSILKAVRKLPAGHLLRCTSCGVTIREYWDAPFADEPSDQNTPWRDELIGHLADSVRIRLRSDVPLGAFLSGGIDSSAVVAEMAQQLPRPVVACTATFDDTEHDEREHARAVARHLQCDYREQAVQPEVRDLPTRIVEAFDEPFADAAAIPNYLLAQAARRHVKVALTGDGGDELFAGYWRHSRERLETRLRSALGPVATTIVPALAPWIAPAGRRAGLARLGMPRAQAYAWKHCGVLFDPTLKSGLYSHTFARTCREFDPSERFRHFYDRCPSIDPVNKALYVDLKTSLADGILVKVDRTSMAHGLEIRSPLLDHEMVEFAMRVPSGLKLRRRRGKHLLSLAMADRLPRQILDRPKHGLTTPVARWLRCEWRESAEECLLGRRAIERGLFERGFVEAMWKTHLSGSDVYAQHLWSLVALELWLRRQTALS